MNLKKGLEKELKTTQNDLKGVYGFEITTTEACNFRCKYCFERNHLPEETLINSEILIKRINELLEDDWFKSQYCGIKLILWGGEPTMNMPLCKALMEEFMKDERICFFVYTNGSTIDELIPTLRNLKEQKFIKPKQSKITIQVSYDGNPIHDMNRIDCHGKPTSEICKKAIKKLHLYGIDYGLKATLPWDFFKYLDLIYEDFKGLHYLYGPKIKYSVTVDYYNVRFYEYRNIVEEGLIKIAQKEIEFFKEHKYYLTNIFKNNRSICATGKSMLVVNTNGDILNCHGSIYSKCVKDFTYSNIFNENFINKVREANALYINNYIEPKECEDCIATSCLRCNVKKYEESKKETHLEKWFDYPAQGELCDYYKLVGKISSAMSSIIGK